MKYHLTEGNEGKKETSLGDSGILCSLRCLLFSSSRYRLAPLFFRAEKQHAETDAQPGDAVTRPQQASTPLGKSGKINPAPTVLIVA